MIRKRRIMREKQSKTFEKKPLPQPPFSKEKLLDICDCLEKTWGMGRKAVSFLEDPLEGLVQTILSQNTNDKNRDRAYARLMEQYPLWENVVSAEEEDLQQAIGVAGLSKIKSNYIRQALTSIKARLGEYSLEKLKSRPCQEIRDFLESMPGVGPKTAACVLLFQFRCPAFPVDTHVTRVARRLGIAEKGHDTRRIEETFRSLLPEHRFLEVHLNFIIHGRNLCLSRNPKCSDCPLSGGMCPSFFA